MGNAVVICRIGSLEKKSQKDQKRQNVICRIGSLESRYSKPPYLWGVICRIGSLERASESADRVQKVICRIGSLENAITKLHGKLECYLPYRQVIYFIVLFLWLTSDGGRLFVLRG